MRSLGEFFGHITHAARTPVSPPAADRPQPLVTRQSVEEEQRDTPQGRVTLRRTVIEEVELPPASEPPARSSGDAQ
jgi:hypothetical protein